MAAKSTFLGRCGEFARGDPELLAEAGAEIFGIIESGSIGQVGNTDVRLLFKKLAGSTETDIGDEGRRGQSGQFLEFLGQDSSRDAYLFSEIALGEIPVIEVVIDAFHRL